MYYFVLFLANSGLRVGEAREMLWSDVKFDVAVEGSDSVIAEVRVSKATKKGEARFVQTQPNANSLLKRWRETSQYNKHNDLVWFVQVCLNMPLIVSACLKCLGILPNMMLKCVVSVAACAVSTASMVISVSGRYRLGLRRTRFDCFGCRVAASTLSVCRKSCFAVCKRVCSVLADKRAGQMFVCATI
jgi:hypothetical protein